LELSSRLPAAFTLTSTVNTLQGADSGDERVDAVQIRRFAWCIPSLGPVYDIPSFFNSKFELAFSSSWF